MSENMHASGLWSISRGLARSNNDYKEYLANADQTRDNDVDGRGNLSNKNLLAFCKYFLEIAIDQVDFMYQLIDVEDMIRRIESFVDLMSFRGLMRTEAKYILVDVFVKGRLTKSDAMRITNTSDKTLKLIIDDLIKRNLLDFRKESIAVVYYPKYPIEFSPVLFPKLYPQEKELDMMGSIA